MSISTTGMTWVQPGSTCEAISNALGGVAASGCRLYIGARGVMEQVRSVVGVAPKGPTSGELRLMAGEPASFLTSMTSHASDWNYDCQVVPRFVLVEVAHYQMLISFDAQQRRCGMALLQLAPTPALVETGEAPKCKAVAPS